jgi:hypothetical protein
VGLPLTEQFLEVGDGLSQTIFEGDLGFPAEELLDTGDVRASLHGIILRQWPSNDFGLGAGQPDGGLGQFAHGNFVWIADVERSCDALVGVHQADETIDQVIDVAECSGLPAVAVEGDLVALQCLDDEVRNDAPVVRVHTWAVGIENSSDLDAYPVLPEVVEEQGLGAALAFIVAGARPKGIDVAAVVLGLRVDGWIAIDLAGRGLQYLCPDALGQAEHVDGTDDAGLVVCTGSNW